MLNSDFYIETPKVVWAGKEVGTVRGICAEDLARIMSENTADLELLMQEVVDSGKYDAIIKDGNALDKNAEKIFATILRLAPTVVAKVIFIAMECTEIEEYERIQKFPVPLQFKIISETARATFVDRGGFKEFLGNVMALAGQEQDETTDQRQLSAVGSTA